MPDSTSPSRQQPTPSSPPEPGRPYRGRFAPSPTGPLHLGSLIAAVASYLDARNNKGSWLVRMDDLDPPREVPGAAQCILDSLQQHGLHWDEDVLWQSRREDAYQRALAQLEPHTFNCDCTRNSLGPNGICQRECQSSTTQSSAPCALRIAVPQDCLIQFSDQLQGPQAVHLGQSSRNFLIHRKDGFYAYQLAVVVDDSHQNVTHIVRGSDLLDTTARQIFLQQALGYHTPTYCHIPVITNAEGQKYSKQNHAPALQNENAAANLRAALLFLNQPAVPATVTNTGGILEFATHHWSPRLIAPTLSITAEQRLVPFELYAHLE